MEEKKKGGGSSVLPHSSDGGYLLPCRPDGNTT